MKQILFHFDFISPYAYLAWKSIHALVERTGAEVVPIPTLFAALLGSTGALGPAEIPPKRRYVFKDAFRTARVLGLPFVPPPSHPFNPLPALRVASLSQLSQDGSVQRKVIDLLYDATWGGGGGIDSPERVRAVLDAAALDGARLVEAAGRPEAKERLRAQTDEAIAAGVFGVPTMRVGKDGELFWGYDSFAHLERHLKGQDPLEGVDVSRFEHIAPSAQRKISR